MGSMGYWRGRTVRVGLVVGMLCLLGVAAASVRGAPVPRPADDTPLASPSAAGSPLDPVATGTGFPIAQTATPEATGGSTPPVLATTTPTEQPSSTATPQRPSATPSISPTRTAAPERATPRPTATATASVVPTASALRLVGTAAPSAGLTVPGQLRRGVWTVRAIDTMKLSRDTLKRQISDAEIMAIVRQDAKLHLTHITADVYYDDPAYLGRWVRAIRATGAHVWFRSHWYAWETHRDRAGTLSPHDYIEATRHFLQQNIALFENGDIFDFCPEPENGAYWLRQYGSGWSWRNPVAKTAFNSFVRSGVYMASSTLANRGRGAVLATAISVDDSIATRMLSKPTVARLGMLTLDLYPEGRTRDPKVAARLLVAEIERVHRRWRVPILLGEHGYARDLPVDDLTQARVLDAELAALARLPYMVGMSYWADAGGVGYGGYTNLYTRAGGGWVPRAAARTLARAYAARGG